MYKKIETDRSKLRYFSGVKSFCSVQNNQPVIDAINKFNVRNKTLSLATLDFYILYTNIPKKQFKDCDEGTYQFLSQRS